MDFLEIMKISEEINISEEEFEDIPVDLNELEIKKSKREIKKRIKSLEDKKLKRKLGVKRLSAVGIFFVVASSLIVFLSKPAFAEKIELFDEIYNKLGYYKEYKDYSQYIGESKTDKGYTFTIEKLVVTPSKAVVAIRVNAEKPFDRDKDKSILENLSVFVNFPNMDAKWGTGSQNVEYIDDNTAILVNESEIYGGYFKKRGDLKINLNSMKIEGVDDVSANFDFKVNFSESFNKVLDRKIDKFVKIGNEETYMKSMQSTILGTHIYFTTFDMNENGKFVLEVDDKIYRFMSWGSGEDGANTFIKELTYDVIKNAKSIKIIPIYKEDVKEEVKQLNSEDLVLNENLKVPQKFMFSKDSQGEIYKVENLNNKLRIYYDNGERTLAEISSMDIYGEGEQDWAKSVIEKDPERKNGYFIEREINDNTKYSLRVVDLRFKYKVGEAVNIK
ncbi:DUF4179 domain-containing protein [Clostridium intestinale]|uniref:DUF4179 domain-containing protein n=1 Tax=Clostridium intestinale DSM 6191 TaxID=1121320 RepID=A0A1M5Z3J5_9CLOT|nr:DUF4179 domain-containing protein [Clostridium intestinale]SHI18832.1 protein of unknown function [Clostridium intestinale DSM 6191]